MSRAGRYKMQKVVRYFQAAPYDWATRRDASLRAARWMFLVLECGHIKRDPWEVYQNETAIKIRAVFYHMANASGQTEVRRVRCHQCISGKQQSGVPATIPPIEEQQTT